ncbi:MAG: hypothetical protein KDK41_15615 [Leptospiraceae bacterium]|nr:hypothetical protein [Leptospiraceae bacterium]
MNMVKLNLPGVQVLPAGCSIIRDDHSYMEILREDGKFKVFLDKREDGDGLNSVLNQVRLYAPPEVVVNAVAMVRGFQIGASYARKNLPEYEQQFKQTLSDLIQKSVPNLFPRKNFLS